MRLDTLTDATSNPATPDQSRLAASARASLLWSGGFTLLRDVAQFGLMLILVRLLSPADYGTAAFAQSVVGFFAMLSYANFSLHALQIRDPANIDWQAHFTAAALINLLIVTLVLLTAFGLTFTVTYHDAALPLAVLGLGFVVEVPATLRARMLEASHDWKRFRLQLMIGTGLGMGVGLTIALLGGGVWALVLQPPMLGLPAAFDLLIVQRFKADWSWSWLRYRDAVWFGLNRVSSGLAGRTRVLNENMFLSNVFDLATLGIFTRANGLAALLAGRIGATAMMTLYPVVTRAERGSARFQRLASLVLRGVCWMTVPAVAFLAVSAHDTIFLLYGPRWASVVPLLPLAAAASGAVGVSTAMSGLLLANEDRRAALSIDLVAAVSAIALAFVLVPYGARAYLVGLSLHAVALMCIAIAMLLRQGAISLKGVVTAIFPPTVAGFVGIAAVLALRASIGDDVPMLLRTLRDGAFLGMAYLLTLRIAFSGQLAELLEVVPGGPMLARIIMLSEVRTELAG